MAAFLLALLTSCPPAQSQQQSRPASGLSELAAENLDRVAASAAQIQEVLRGDAGLLVELKRWVAKEASDYGQIVDDSDLTDQVIFSRLATDLRFRAVATRLLQRYGHLLPKASPGSEAGLQQELLLRERQRQLQRVLAEEEKGQGSQRQARAAAGRGASGAPAPSADLPPSPPAPRNPLEDVDVRPRPLLQTNLGKQPELSSPPGETLPVSTAVSKAEEGANTLAAEMHERGAVSPAPPERGPGRAVRSSASAPQIESLEEENADRPAIIRPANPYSDLPSLYDMYAQVSAQRPALMRFGTDVFHNGTGNSGQLPMDLPAGPDYVVGPGDGLAIDLWGGVAQRLYRIVDREGRLSLPEVGPVLVSGRTMSEVQRTVQQILRTQFRDVSADVSLSRLRTVRVYVVGDVEEAGAYDISSLSTPLNALFASGGPTARGSLRLLRHFRGKQLVQEVDVYDLLLHGIRSDLKRLENGDTVMVPPIGPQVTVEGMVRRPAIYELRGEKTLAEVLDLAGGILPTAALRQIQVQRVEAHQKHTMLSLDLPETGGSEEINKQLQSFATRDRDEIRIFPIAPYNQDAIYLQGHVLRPGRYSFRAGMKLTDLVAAYADLLPEPAEKYAEIVRLNPPDYRPSVESFDLAAALANPAAAPKLQPLDTVRIFSRYDFESAPTVWVGGEVRTPGPYRTSGQLHLRDAIYLAGGLTPDALLDTAQLMRSLSDSSLKILSINLGQALAGNPLENIVLQPRDRILVHRNLAKVDPPSVFLKGEVAKPGRYPLTTNLRVEDLIRLGGGLKRSAYAESADLTRYLIQGSKVQVGEHRDIGIVAALAGDPNHDLPLYDGDVLTIRQLPGWNDIGATIAVQGEIEYPGAYGIRPGERLSSVLKRAGGFRPTAYPRAAVLVRGEVRELQEKSRQELIQRLEQGAATVKVSLSESAKEQAELQQAALEQRQRVLEGLRKAPVSGRLVVNLSSNLPAFENSVDDIEVRSGDTLFIPKRPGIVLVTGQVYNSNAIAFEPRKTAAWYLTRAGGPTKLASTSDIFVVRANGAVVSGAGEGWWNRRVLSTRIEPGDTIVVPEKAIGGSSFWKNLVAVAQVAQSASVAALVATR